MFLVISEKIIHETKLSLTVVLYIGNTKQATYPKNFKNWSRTHMISQMVYSNTGIGQCAQYSLCIILCREDQTGNLLNGLQKLSPEKTGSTIMTVILQ